MNTITVTLHINMVYENRFFYFLFSRYLKDDFISLSLDKVITVRMALTRVLLSKPSIAYDPEVQIAINKLKKDRCGDIRELVSQGYEDLMSKATNLQTPEPLLTQDSTQDENSMIMHCALTEPDDTSSDDMLHLEIMVEDAMQAAI